MIAYIYNHNHSLMDKKFNPKKVLKLKAELINQEILNLEDMNTEDKEDSLTINPEIKNLSSAAVSV